MGSSTGGHFERISASLLAVSLLGKLAVPVAFCAPETATAGSDSHAAIPEELPEILVTAQRREESLQDVPITVNQVSAAQMQAAGIQNMQDLGVVVPGLFVGNEVGFAILHLRGVGSTTVAPGVESPIATYVDGVYYASTSSMLFDFLDVENVQVSKGPQGTLFGRNATGGLIQVTTKEPTQELLMDVNAGYGNYSTGHGNLYLTGGIVSNISADLALQVSGAGEGYGRNLLTGNDVYRNDLSFGFRSKWAWEPSDLTMLTASFDFSKQRNSDVGLRLPPGASNLPGLPVPLYGSYWDVAENIDPLYVNQNGGLSLRLVQDVGFAKFVNLLAYRRASTIFHLAGYQSEVPFLDGLMDTEENQLSEEVQLSSEPNAPIVWVNGIYYFRGAGGYDPLHAIFGPPTANLYSNVEQVANSVAGYGQATATILPRTNLTLGVRYTYETHNIVGDQRITLPDGTIFSDTYYPRRSVSFDKPTYRVALDHHLSNDLLLYFSYTTGFKSGGFNTGSIGDPAYLPETVAAYEAGVKSELLGHRLRLNVSGFRYDYSNIQVQKIEGEATGIINGGTATVNGADLDSTFVATNHLSFKASAEYLDAHFSYFPNAPLSNPDLALTTPVMVGSAAGKQLPYAPHFSFTLAADYAINLSTSKLTLDATVNRVSSVALEPDNVIMQPAYTMLNASARWSVADDRYAVMLWGKNLTNEAVIAFGGTLVIGLHTVAYEAPRTYGVTFQYKYR